jgi:hypothetical protein
MIKRVVRWLTAVLVVTGMAVVPSAAADGACGGVRIYAVDSGTGHLVEIPSCPSPPAFGAPVEVDSSDWRGYPAVFAARDGGAAIVYAVTSTGELWWRRQESAGATLSGPVRVGASIDWARPMVFASRSGYLHLGTRGMPVRTFHHRGWASGGMEVSEEQGLFTMLGGPFVTGMAPQLGFAMSTWNGTFYRVWRSPNGTPGGLPYDDVWSLGGALPRGVGAVAGDEKALYAIGPAGEVLLLSQAGGIPACTADRNSRPWQTIARAPGNYGRVVVPVRDSFAETPAGAAPPPPMGGAACAPQIATRPWEWQLTP